MKFKYVTNSLDGDDCRMLLGKQIGNTYNEDGSIETYGIDGYAFASEIKALAEMGKKVTVDINSPGGSVLEGYTIGNAIQQYNCNTHIMGLAASMAAVVSCMGKNRTATNYAVMMFHPVKSEDALFSGITQDSLIDLVTANTRLNGDTTKQIFSKETYFSNSSKSDYNLQDAVSMGILHNIVDTGKRMPLNKVKGISAIYNLFNKELTTINMSKINAALNLKEDDKEEKAIEAINSLTKENSELKTKIATLEKEKTDREAKEVENKKTTATAFVDGLIKDGKEKAENKDKIVALALVDLDTVKNMYASKIDGKKAVNVFNPQNVKANTTGREEWTIRDWEKKDPKGLENLQKESPEVYNQMYENFYVLKIGNNLATKFSK